MNIAEMHVWFRQYAQQMGMQNVRAILPEQIDLLINSSISDTINQVITQNIGITNDRIITDNSKLGQINALRSLYKVLKVNAIPNKKSGSSTEQPFRIGQETTVYKIYSNLIDLNQTKDFDCLFFVDFAINYKNGDSITNYFPVRLIDDAFLADTLNDFVLKPKLRSPIAVIYNKQIDVYINEAERDLIGIKLPYDLEPNEFRISYIDKPAKVAYLADLDQDNVDCDLPEYMHVDILKHAVDLYRISVSGALSAAQQADQNQQRENARNTYRNDNTQQ